MNEDLRRACDQFGIEPAYWTIDGVHYQVPEETLAFLVEALGAHNPPTTPPPTIADVRADLPSLRCFVPDELRDARVWGITCQLASLASARNTGIGDFADLAALCRVAAAEGADFVGINPLHALFWSDPSRISPFYPSNRRLLNPLYIALDRVEGFAELRDGEANSPGTRSPLIDMPAVTAAKDAALRRLFAGFPWTAESRATFDEFRATGADDLLTHALFEAISAAMVANGEGPTPPSWPEALRQRQGAAVAEFAAAHGDAIDYHIWLQWIAKRQLGAVQNEARAAGLRVGLYSDFAVGAAPDGSAAWGDPDLTLPELSVGSPPDPFSMTGQDWGLAPLSPVRLSALEGQPLGDGLAAAGFGSGAMRIDHAMGLARMFFIPRGAAPAAGAYVRYPLRNILERVAEFSHRQGTIVIGEDLGLVPEGFRELMSAMSIHCYKVMLTERDHDGGFHDPQYWPVEALACIGTHDMPTLTGWWQGADLEVRRSLGLVDDEGFEGGAAARGHERQRLLDRIGGDDNSGNPSVRVHAAMAASPCRLAALQIEDALGLPHQVNVPGTIDQYPNWRRRLPVTVEALPSDPAFRAHTAAMRAARPK